MRHLSVILAVVCAVAQIYHTAAPPAVSLERAFFRLAFSSPVFLTHSGDGTNRIFVVEQTGAVKVFPNDPAVTRQDVHVYLDLAAAMSRFHNEAGVLGLAFHPDYRNNGYLYVNYTRGNPNRTVISRFTVDPDDPNRADPNSELVILEIPQPFGNHNAGMMQFGPADGYLYVSTGDGGDRRDGVKYPADSEGNGQNLETLHGAILRIDVDRHSEVRNYAIPPDNPFASDSDGKLEEIWAYGLRNPWRFSFDTETNELWVADVGDKAWEEIILVERGGNYGWSIMEGPDCFESTGCDPDPFRPALLDLPHEEGCNSVTGGYVYRGGHRPELHGAYLYGDYCRGYVAMVRRDGEVVTEHRRLMDTKLRISSFGVDEEGELYVVNHNGNLYRFTPSAGSTSAERVVEAPRSFALEQNHPNPFRPATEIRYALERAADVELTVLDVTGRRIRTLISEWQEAGVHVVGWNGTDDAGAVVAAGVYLYTLRAGATSQTRRMVRLK